MESKDNIVKIILKIFLAILIILFVLISLIFIVIPSVKNAVVKDISSEELSVGKSSAVDCIKHNLQNNKTKFLVYAPTEDCLSEAIEIIFDDPTLFWLGRKYSVLQVAHMYYVQFEIYYSNHVAMMQEIDVIVDGIIDGIDNNSTDYEKVLYIHDELCRRIAYYDSGDEYAHNMYGALVNCRCVCEGYAKAFMYVLGKADIEAFYFSGTSNRNGNAVPHSWNGAIIGGELYYFDLTWDDIGSEQEAYFYFGLNSTDIIRNHSFDEYHKIIDTDAYKFNYYYYNDYVLYDYSKENVAEIINRQNSIVDIKCESVITYSQLENALTNAYQLESILRLSGNPNVEFNELLYVSDENTLTIRMVFK